MLVHSANLTSATSEGLTQVVAASSFNAVFSDRDGFAVDHRVALYALQCFGDLDIAVTDDLAVAAVERNLAPPISAILTKPF